MHSGTYPQATDRGGPPACRFVIDLTRKPAIAWHRALLRESLVGDALACGEGARDRVSKGGRKEVGEGGGGVG
ncbi:hypothetical protein GCM10011399_18680 [Subtercola lobariae]|uniref:Uncharacterized protein n=1 Tax=Subtercola lobariae TaxID=1588641 RepID=A0A917B6A0_9MICO|nr:hypothetical protein GCM10011399_18680 [Subtercola lobariae]